MVGKPLTFNITPQMHGWRLDRALAALAADAGLSRERCKKYIQDGRALLNGQVVVSPKTTVSEGDALVLDAEIPTSELVPEGGELKIIYRDEHLLVIDKPAGLTVHPCPSCPRGTLVHRLLHHFPDLEGDGERPGIVHRLDKDTSGLLLVARTEKCRLRLAAQFAGREVDKAYAALTHGAPRPAEGEINAPLARHPTHKTRMAVQPGGREAITRYQTVHADAAGLFALLDVHILTGRTHQIRAHLAHLGHPLWGDGVYGGKTHLPGRTGGAGSEVGRRVERGGGKGEAASSQENGPLVATRQMLHARRLAFRHPESGEWLRFDLPPPEDFRAALRVLLQEPLRLVITGLPGCGKSALLAALADKGLPVFSADAAVDRLYAAGGAGWDLLHRRFGGRFTPRAEAPVDRRALGAAMREDAALRPEVEHLIHPLVKEELNAFWLDNAAAGAAAAEIPLYFEAGWHMRGRDGAPPALFPASSPAGAGDFPPLPAGPRFAPGGRPLPVRPGEPIILTISCPEKMRLAGLAQRGLSPEAARALIAWQWPEGDKIKAAHLELRNNESLPELQAAAGQLADWLALARARRAELAAVRCLERFNAENI